MDFSHDGRKLATGCTDGQVRIYDELTKEEWHIFERGGWNHRGHSNRIFCCHFANFDDNVLLTGGWDRTVMLWDIRAKNYVGCFYGPNVCGNAISTTENGKIYTGAWRGRD